MCVCVWFSFIYTCMYLCTHIHICTHTTCTHTLWHTHRNTNIYTISLNHPHMHVSTYVYTYTHIHAYTYEYIYTPSYVLQSNQILMNREDNEHLKHVLHENEPCDRARHSVARYSKLYWKLRLPPFWGHLWHTLQQTYKSILVESNLIWMTAA